MRIAVVGAGYVGLVSAACLAEVGHDVVCVDLDPVRVDSIMLGRAPIYEAGLPELLRKHVGERLRATTELASAIQHSDVSLIAVGTPFSGGEIDLSAVRTVARQIGQALRGHEKYHVVTVKSTVVPGTTERVLLPILEEASGKRAGPDFGVGMVPEFLTEGTAVKDFLQPDRLVLGGIDERTRALLAEAFRSFSEVPTLHTNPSTAEMVKYASNALLATLISLSNEFANLAAELGGIDSRQVVEGVHLSRYFTTRMPDGQRVTAPLASFFHPGCGYGGSCLPKDTKSIAVWGARSGSPMQVLEAVIKVNEEQPGRMLGILRRHFPSLVGVRVAVLGLAFRPDTDDMRESPAIPVVRALVDAGALVRAYDPVADDTARSIFAAEPVTICVSLEDAVKGSDAVLVMTFWEEFGRLPQLLDAVSPPIVIDGRLAMDPHSVPRYDGIGR